MKHIALTIVCLLWIINIHARSYAPAIPYIQTCDGQDVTVKAWAYQPYMPFPYGATKVYLKDKLLYTIDMYTRYPSFTSNDGKYFAIVYTTGNLTFKYIDSGARSLIVTDTIYDYTHYALEIYKDGIPYKIYTLGDVADTTLPIHITGRYNDIYDWGYIMNWESEEISSLYFSTANCKKDYGDGLEKCSTTSADKNDCDYCKRELARYATYQKDSTFKAQSIYVKNNKLHVIGNHDVVTIDFSNDCVIGRLSMHEVINDKDNFNPPKVHTTYSDVELPKKFASPLLASGNKMDSSLCAYLGLTTNHMGKKGKCMVMFIERLTIKRNGLCEEADVWISDEPDRRNKCLSQYTNEQLEKRIEEWLMLQRYDTRTILKTFDKYAYYHIIYAY